MDRKDDVIGIFYDLNIKRLREVFENIDDVFKYFFVKMIYFMILLWKLKFYNFVWKVMDFILDFFVILLEKWCFFLLKINTVYVFVYFGV